VNRGTGIRGLVDLGRRGGRLAGGWRLRIMIGRPQGQRTAGDE